MTDTPETDQAIQGANGQWCFELRDFARRLERERDAARKALRRVAMLNPDAGEIGAGMLKTIVAEAKEALGHE